MNNEFQPDGKNWAERAKLYSLNKVLDPDCQSLSNLLIDLLQKKKLEKVMLKYKFKKILDFGCGSGRLYAFFAKYATYFGIDITKEMIEVAKSSYEDNKDRFLVYDGYKIPFQNNSFDLVCSVLVLQHFRNELDLKKMAFEFNRICELNGYCIFIEQVYDKKDGQKYNNAFFNAGFVFVSKEIVRRGRSISSYIASHTDINNDSILKILYWINRIEILFPALVNTYTENIFIYRKVKNNV